MELSCDIFEQKIFDHSEEISTNNEYSENSEKIQQNTNDISNENNAKLFWSNPGNMDTSEKWDKNMQEIYKSLNLANDLTNIIPELSNDDVVYMNEIAKKSINLENSLENYEHPSESSTEPEQSSESSTEPEQSSESSTEPEQSSESSTEPEQSSESSSEPEQSSESSTEPEQSSESSTEPEQSSESSTEPEQSSESSTEPEQSSGEPLSLGSDLYSKIPNIIFIVPYRNREEHLEYFKNHMKSILEDFQKQTYSIYYIHQCDERVFNRGAMKNIGFLMVKKKYPNDYKNITLVFNDVDSMPANKSTLNYHTVPGVVKHFYGFTYTLGGIVSINAYDFEKINGYPNFWAWGYEDNMLNKRAIDAKYKIDRNNFFKIMDKNIIHLNNTVFREVNEEEYVRFMNNTNEGIHSITDLVYTIDESTGFINVTNFSTEHNPDITKYRLHDLRNGTIPYDTKIGLMYISRHKSRFKKKMGMIF
jgi:hypothetical protein